MDELVLKGIVESNFNFSIIDITNEKEKNEIIIEKIKYITKKKERIICISSSFEKKEILFKQLYEIKEWLNYNWYIITHLSALIAGLFADQTRYKVKNIITKDNEEDLRDVIEICSFGDKFKQEEILNFFKDITENNIKTLDEYYNFDNGLNKEDKKYIYELLLKCNFGLRKNNKIWIQNLYMSMANNDEPLELEYKKKKDKIVLKDFKHIIVDGADEISIVQYKILKKLLNSVKRKYTDYTITLICNSENTNKNSFITPETLEHMVNNYKQIKYFKI